MFMVIDLETTHREPQDAHVVEWALQPCDRDRLHRRYQSFVRPPIPIPAETSAVHHIIDADVAHAGDWASEAATIQGIVATYPATAMVAHNAEFERHFLEALVPDLPWICTYKAALRVWPQAPAHGNEALRYWLGLGAGRSEVQQPHSAAHDATVTAQILQRLLKYATVEDLRRWTDEPALLPRCPIGQYRGLAWDQVPADFLQWILYKAVDMRKDVYHSADLEYRRRFKLEA